LCGEIECAREGRFRGEQLKAIGTINARYTSSSKERYNANEGKPARRSAQIRSQLNSGVTCARSRLSRTWNRDSFSRRFRYASFAPVCVRSRSSFLGLLFVSTPFGFFSRMPRWTQLAWTSNSKTPASEHADLSLGLTYITYGAREKSLATAAQWSTGRRYKGLCVVIRGYDGGNISLSGLHCNVTARGPSPISSRRNLFLSPSPYPAIFSTFFFLLFFLPLFPLSLPSSIFSLLLLHSDCDSIQLYLVLNSAFKGLAKKRKANANQLVTPFAVHSLAILCALGT